MVAALATLSRAAAVFVEAFRPGRHVWYGGGYGERGPGACVEVGHGGGGGWGADRHAVEGFVGGVDGEGADDGGAPDGSGEGVVEVGDLGGVS